MVENVRESGVEGGPCSAVECRRQESWVNEVVNHFFLSSHPCQAYPQTDALQEAPWIANTSSQMRHIHLRPPLGQVPVGLPNPQGLQLLRNPIGV